MDGTRYGINSIDDQELICVTCGSKFTFTAGEHRFYLSKGLSIPPRHCSQCRHRRRSTINNDGGQFRNIDDVLARATREKDRW